MQNMELNVKGDVLTIKVDLSKSFGRTKKGTGPNTSVASSCGNVPVPGKEQFRLGLNLYRYGFE